MGIKRQVCHRIPGLETGYFRDTTLFSQGQTSGEGPIKPLLPKAPQPAPPVPGSLNPPSDPGTCPSGPNRAKPFFAERCLAGIVSGKNKNYSIRQFIAEGGQGASRRLFT